MNWLGIIEKTIAGLIVVAISFYCGLFYKYYFAVDPFQEWYSVRIPKTQSVAGTWKVTYPNGEFPDEIIEIHQRGPRVWGEGMDVKWGMKYELLGQVAGSGYIIFEVKSSLATSRYIGSGLLKLSVKGNSAVGFVTQVDEDKDSPVTTKLWLNAK